MNPLSATFGSVVALRNRFYDQGLFKVNKLARPVVSVGNISVGGSGKTPFVIALGELLKQRGIAFDVLSRGYRRQSAELAVVDPLGSPRQFGDEPLLIARTLGIPVIVGRDRYQAGLLAEEALSAKLHILDDGFQHRRLHRDFDIVMLPAADLKDALLPVGRLREPFSALRRADAVVTSSSATIPASVGVVWRVGRDLLLDPPRNLSALVFCGVARPQTFFEELKMLHAYGSRISQTMTFPDHHRYTPADIQRLLRAKAEKNADCFITTEKDEINLGALASQLQPLRVARLRLVLENPEIALKMLLEALEKRNGCTF